MVSNAGTESTSIAGLLNPGRMISWTTDILDELNIQDE